MIAYAIIWSGATIALVLLATLCGDKGAVGIMAVVVFVVWVMTAVRLRHALTESKNDQRRD